MKVTEIQRAFTYNGLKLPDPNPSLPVEQVKAMFAMQFPELNNSVVEGPITKGGIASYTFVRAVGSKG